MSEKPTHAPDAHALAAFVTLMTLLAELEKAGTLPEGGRTLIMERALQGLEVIPPGSGFEADLIQRARQALEAWL